MPRKSTRRTKRRTTSSPSKISVKIGSTKRTYTRVQCSKRKTDAKKKADAIRKKGGTARVRKNGTTYCVYKGPKAKRRTKRR